MADDPLPEPYQSIRALERECATRIGAIDPTLPRQVREGLGLTIWFEITGRLKPLRKRLPRKQPCLATTAAGKPCSRWAYPDYIGQRCAMHIPHLNDW